MARIIKRKLQETHVLAVATLIAIDHHGRVLLTKNEQGIYELPHTMLNKKQALENTLRSQTKAQTGVDVGTIKIWEANTVGDHPFHTLEIVYTSEDLLNVEAGSFFDLDDLPVNITTKSEAIIEAYNVKMKESFMHFVCAYGHFL